MLTCILFNDLTSQVQSLLSPLSYFETYQNHCRRQQISTKVNKCKVKLKKQITEKKKKNKAKKAYSIIYLPPMDLPSTYFVNARKLKFVKKYRSRRKAQQTIFQAVSAFQPQQKEFKQEKKNRLSRILAAKCKLRKKKEK